MATTTTEAATIPEVEDLWYQWPHRVDWDFYRKILRLRGERGVPRVLYLDGSLYFMTPSHIHETIKERLSVFVKLIAIGLSIPCRPAGSMTLKKRSKEAGVEGDATFYIASVPRIAGKRSPDLRRDPPPDLAIEVVYKHGVAAAQEVYRRLRVPELWVAYEQRFEIFVLGKQGGRYRYTPAERSLAFPFLTAAEIADWIARPWGEDETPWMQEVHRWVLETLAPRVAQAGPDS